MKVRIDGSEFGPTYWFSDQRHLPEIEIDHDVYVRITKAIQEYVICRNMMIAYEKESRRT